MCFIKQGRAQFDKAHLGCTVIDLYYAEKNWPNTCSTLPLSVIGVQQVNVIFFLVIVSVLVMATIQPTIGDRCYYFGRSFRSLAFEGFATVKWSLSIGYIGCFPKLYNTLGRQFSERFTSSCIPSSERLSLHVVLYIPTCREIISLYLVRLFKWKIISSSIHSWITLLYLAFIVQNLC